MTAPKTVHFSRPYQFHGREDDGYFAGLEHNAHLLGAYAQVLRAVRPQGVLDVGANIGLTVILAHDLGASDIVALEPSPGNFQFLTENVALNDVQARLLNQAAAREVGTLSFHDATFGAGAHVVTSETLHVPHAICVDALPLDSLLPTLPKIDVLKMDIEGFELSGLAGAERLIAQHQPTAFIELNAWTMIAFANENPRTLIQRVRDLFPYVVSPLPGGGFATIPADIAMNALIYRNIVLNGGVDDLVGTFSEAVRDALMAQVPIEAKPPPAPMEAPPAKTRTIRSRLRNRLARLLAE